MDLLCYSPVRWREEKERHSYINHWPPRLKVTVCLPGVAWHHRAVLVTSVLAWCSACCWFHGAHLGCREVNFDTKIEPSEKLVEKVFNKDGL